MMEPYDFIGRHTRTVERGLALLIGLTFIYSSFHSRVPVVDVLGLIPGKLISQVYGFVILGLLVKPSRIYHALLLPLGVTAIWSRLLGLLEISQMSSEFGVITVENLREVALITLFHMWGIHIHD